MSLGTLTVNLAVSSAQFTEGLSKAARDSELNFGKMRDDAVRMGQVIGVALVAATTAVVTFTKMAINNADAMGKMAQGAGVATQTFSEYSHAAKLSNLSNEQLAQAFSKLNVSIIDAARGTGEASRAYKTLGIDVHNANGSLKSSDQVMEEVADALMGIEHEGVRAGLATKIFGERLGKDMLPMLSGGSAGLKQMREEARALGVTLDTETGKAAEKFNDDLTRLGQVQQGLVNTFMKEMLPVLNQFTGDIVKAATGTGSLVTEVEEAANGVKVLAIRLLTVSTAAGIAQRSLAAAENSWSQVVKAALDFKWGEALSPAHIERIKEAAAGAGKVLGDTADENRKAWLNLQLMIGGVESTMRKFQGGAMDMGVGLHGLFKPPAPGKPTPDLSGAKEIAAEAAKAARILQARQEGAQAFFDQQVEVGLLTQELLAEQSAAQIDADKAIYDARIAAMIDFHDREQEAAIAAGAVLLEISRNSMTAVEKFQRMSYKQQASTIFDELHGITAGVAQHNRQMFELNKVAGIARAVINMHTGISHSLGAYPWPLAGIMAAAHGAAGLAQISAISSASFQGGGRGSAPSIAGSTPAQPVTPVAAAAAPSQTSTVKVIRFENFPSDEALLSGKQFRRLLEQFAEEMPDGGRVVIG